MADSNSRDLPQSDCNGDGKVDSVAADYTEIIVIRHGETEWNANKRVQGHLDVALNDVGRQQAAAVIKDLDLQERHLGDLQGVVYHEMAKVNPKAYQALSSHTTDQEIPGGGESFDQVYQRCTSSLQKIGRKHKGERVVVVTHGGVIEALYKRASSSGRTVGKILNTSLDVFHLSDGDIWTIKVRGNVSHLNTTGFLKSGFGGDSTSG